VGVPDTSVTRQLSQWHRSININKEEVELMGQQEGKERLQCSSTGTRLSIKIASRFSTGLLVDKEDLEN